MVHKKPNSCAIRSAFRYPLFLCGLLAMLLAGGSLAAEDMPYFSVAPITGMPLGGSASLYSFTLGASAAGHFPIGALGLEATAGLDYQNAFLQASAGNLTLLRASGGLGWTFLRQEVFSLGLWTRAGAFLAMYGGNDPLVNPFVSAGLRADVRIADGVSLALEPGYDQLFARDAGGITSFYSGISAALRVFIEPAKALVGTRRPKLKIAPPIFGSVFPVAYKYYDKNAFGSVTLENAESSTITDIQVKIFVPAYMQAPTTVTTIKEMKRGEVVDIPLTALFSSEVLKITETDTVQSQITVVYTAGKDVLEVDQTASLRMYSRNTITWDDDRRAAAFVTANDPTVKKLASNAVAAIGEGVATPFTDSMRSAMVVFTALQHYGIQYKIDPNSSYIELSKTGNAPDYLQFPIQTLDYRTGDCDDLSILYTAMLEAVGVEAAFITVPGHIYTAFALGQDLDAAKQVYSSFGDLVVDEGGKVWVPVEATMLDKGFVAAWAAGAEAMEGSRRQQDRGAHPGPRCLERVRIDVVRQQRAAGCRQSIHEDRRNRTEVSRHGATARGAGARTTRRRPPEPDQDQIERPAHQQARHDVRTLRDLRQGRGPVQAGCRVELRAGPCRTSATCTISRATTRTPRPSTRRRKSLNPDSVAIVLSLARARYEQEEWAKAKQLYAEAKVLDPSLAESFAYLGGGTAESARAVDVKQRQGVSLSLWGE